MYRLMFALLFFVISAPSFAHAGHNHSSPMAGLYHLFWLAPLMLCIGVVVYQVNKHRHSSTHKK